MLNPAYGHGMSKGDHSPSTQATTSNGHSYSGKGDLDCIKNYIKHQHAAVAGGWTYNKDLGDHWAGAWQ